MPPGRARALVADWMARQPGRAPGEPPGRGWARGSQPGSAITTSSRASAEDVFRQRLMARLVSTRGCSRRPLPADELDARGLTALKGLIAAAVALPDHAAFLTRALRFLPQEIARQVLPDGCHVERSPAAHLAALQDLTEIRALLQAAQAQPPAALAPAIERMAPALRALRHGDGGLVLFNGAKEEQAGPDRSGADPGRAAAGAHRRAARRAASIACRPGAACCHGLRRAASGRDRPHAHAGTLSMELSVGRERLIVNCGAMPVAGREWRDATRATAAHSTLDDRRHQLLRAAAARPGPAPGGGGRAAPRGERRAPARGEP